MVSNKLNTLFYFLTLYFILLQFQTLTTSAAVQSSTETNVTASPSKPNTTDCVGKNCTIDGKNRTSIFGNLLNNKPMLMRAFYVLLAVTSIVVVYFVIRAYRLRRKRNKSRKYGLITARGTDMEMAPLDQDDTDDEDMTVYEMNNRKK